MTLFDPIFNKVEGDAIQADDEYFAQGCTTAGKIILP